MRIYERQMQRRSGGLHQTDIPNFSQRIPRLFLRQPVAQ
jgi:hypothetical protein